MANRGVSPKANAIKRTAATSERAWSPRSQASLIKEHQLKIQIAGRQREVAACQTKIEILDKEASDTARFCAVNGPILRSRLKDQLHDLEVEKRMSEIHQGEVAKLQAEIQKLSDTVAPGCDERAKKQAALAVLARARLATDRLVAGAIDSLKILLSQREQETEKMRELARTIDLNVEGDGLDVQRFYILGRDLPTKLLAQSLKWVGRFLGEAEIVRTISVREEMLILPETLASAHFYVRGDSVQLTAEDEAKMFPRRPEVGERP